MRKLISTFILCFCTICLVSAQDTFWLGADISGTTMHEKHGRQLYNAKGEPRENTQLMKELGLNSIRLRVWVEPKDSLCNKEDMLKLALRAKHYGMPVMIDFHYSDHWADPAHQDIPKSWQHLSYKKMKKALYKHTKETLALLKKHDIDVRWVQVGNETTQGFLWPMGHTKENMEQYAGLTQSGYEAVKKVYPDAALLVHPESPASVVELADMVGSTSQISQAAKTLPNPQFIVATDQGIFYKLKQQVPDKDFIIAPTAGEGAACKSCALCPWMAMNSLDSLLDVLENLPAANEVHVPEDVIERALVPLERMVNFAADQRVVVKGNA